LGIRSSPFQWRCSSPELKNSITEYENSAGEETKLEEYLQQVSLYTNEDIQENRDKVKMMTIHTAKGLEFPYVFICGFNEGIFPSRKTNTKEKMEEERRLAYVGFTRAENALFLSDAEGINRDGSYKYPSRFIFNIDKKYLNYVVELEENFIDNANDFITNSENILNRNNNIQFNVGDRIIHKSFGAGKIIKIDNINSSYVIKFDNSETYSNISFSMKLENENSDNFKDNSIDGQKNLENKIILEIKNESNNQIKNWIESAKKYI
ncbi:3'-5' exonuclease, partial [Clostridium sp. MT-14]|uniref:3'-5' exonuclease n=1 Tax=Clostridium sp. MT-14 TaxID=3348360 RepID=UPI0035F4734C